jgi:hypothetical protein
MSLDPEDSMAKRKVCGGAATMITLLLLASPLFAHHGFTVEYDSSNCSTVTGTLTRLQWENPHVYFYVDAKDASGNPASWAFEAVSLEWLKRVGTTRRDFSDNIGKTVAVRACMARNGTKNRGAAETLKLEDGRTITVGTDYEHPKGGGDNN